MGQQLYGLGRPAGIQGAGDILAHIGLEVVHREGGGPATVLDVALGKGYRNRVLCIFAVYHNLVSGHPGGLVSGTGQFKGKLKGYRFYFLLLVRLILIRIAFRLCAGEQEGCCRNYCYDCKYLFHMSSFL